jgi:putative FmdB family regulatory protein
MPLYEYECEACGQHFELIRRFSDPEVDVCSRCGKGPVRRLLSSPAIQFKGSGWYITDYARKAKSETAKSGTSGETSGDGKGDAGAGEKKSEGAAKPDAAPASTSSSSSETKP